MFHSIGIRGDMVSHDWTRDPATFAKIREKAMTHNIMQSSDAQRTCLRLMSARELYSRALQRYVLGQDRSTDRMLKALFVLDIAENRYHALVRPQRDLSVKARG